MMKISKIIAIVPAYNEEKIILSVLKELKKEVNEIVVIDDGSKDMTAELAEKEGVFVLKHLINLGQGASLKTGLEFALQKGADIIITFDADGQHKASEIKKIVKPIIEGECEVVLGSRFLENKSDIPQLRKFILKIATIFSKLSLGLEITDTHNGFRAFSRKAASLIDIKQAGMAHASEILQEIKKNNLSFKEVPVTIEYTSYSKGKGQSSLNALKILWDLLIQKLL